LVVAVVALKQVRHLLAVLPAVQVEVQIIQALQALEHQAKGMQVVLVPQVQVDGQAAVAVVQAKPAEMQQVPQVVLVVMVSHLQLQVLL
jgi:hypothetical protein